MMREKLKQLTNDDLAKICGGQIYQVNEGCYIVPTSNGFLEFKDVKDAEKYAPKYVNTNIVVCSSYEEAAEKALADSEIYSVISVFPF